MWVAGNTANELVHVTHPMHFCEVAAGEVLKYCRPSSQILSDEQKCTTNMLLIYPDIIDNSTRRANWKTRIPPQ